MEPEVVSSMFSTEQITSISGALNVAIENTLSMFVDLLPVAAVICGVAFGIRYIRGLFSQVKKGK